MSGRNFPGSGVPLPPSMGGRYRGGTLEAAEHRRMSLDRAVADLAPGERIQEIRGLSGEVGLQDITGTPVALITVDVVDGEPRAYLVVPAAPGVQPTVTSLREDLEVLLEVGGQVVVLSLLPPDRRELEVHDVEVTTDDGHVVRGERGVIRPLPPGD